MHVHVFPEKLHTLKNFSFEFNIKVTYLLTL